MPELVKKGDRNYIDYLDQDPVIPSQKYCLLSFVAPDARQKSSKMAVKFRGAFATEEEARRHCKNLLRFDPDFDVFVADSFVWILANPNPEDVQDEEYQEEALNELVKSAKEHQILSRQHFDDRRRTLMAKVMADGTQRAQAQKSTEKEHLISLRSRLEQTDEELKELERKMTELVNKRKEDKINLKNYTEEEIAEANKIEETERLKREGKLVDDESLSQISGQLDNDVILTHSQRKSMKEAGLLEDRPEEYEVNLDFEKKNIPIEKINALKQALLADKKNQNNEKLNQS